MNPPAFRDPRLTEQRNPRTARIDVASTLEIVDLINAEDALRATNARFRRRFAGVVRRAAAAGKPMKDIPLAELDRYWEEAKKDEV